MQKALLPNPLRGVSLSVRFRHFCYDHFGEISLRYWWRALKLFTISIIRVSFSVREKVEYANKIDSTIIKQDPIFIIGHWRSGTTYLHNLLVADPFWGYPSLFHTSFPQCFFSYEKIKSDLGRQLPSTRIMDNMSVSFDLPQEDEFAIANLSRFSFYHGLTYPKHFLDYFDKYILFDGMSTKELLKWKETYIHFLKKVSLFWDGKPLILKNPVNTGRITTLLQMFPNAKFIHVHRHPLEVYYSTKKMLSMLIDTMALHKISAEVLNEYILQGYERLMNSYLKNKHYIPSKQIFDLSYSELTKQPENKILEIYNHFDLDHTGLPNIKKYIAQLKAYQPNQFNFNSKETAIVKKRWQDIALSFGYSMEHMDL